MICSLKIPLFCSFDLTCLNFSEFLLPQQQQQQKRSQKNLILKSSDVSRCISNDNEKISGLSS